MDGDVVDVEVLHVDRLVEGVEPPGLEHGGCVGPFPGEEEPRVEHVEEV